jgi:nucleotide-binding universal stress UspA family protein
MHTTFRQDQRASFGVIDVLPVIERARLDSAKTADSAPAGTLPEAEPRPIPIDLAGRVVLLATDGSPAAASAARIADALAAKHGAIVHAISVLDTRGSPIPPPLDLALAITDAATGPLVHAKQVAVVREALSANVGQPVDWPVHVMIGTPATAIAQEAKRLHAALIVMGLRRHGALDRAVHDETTLSVIRRAGCPVLGVTPGHDTLPRRVLAATDFGRASITAAIRATTVLDDDGMVLLAYVPPIVADGMEEGEAVIRELGVAAAFDRAAAELAAQRVRVDHVVLHHKLPQSVAKLVLEHAGAARADLISAGSMRHGRLDQWLLGSVSTELVRDGRRSVLIVPPSAGVLERDRTS